MMRDEAHIGLAGLSRAALVGLGLAVMFGGLALRAAHVALQDQPEQVQARSDAATGLRRADIVDRNGELLATSVAAYSLYADPRAIWDAAALVDALMAVFPDLPRGDLIRRLENRERRFEWIKRGLTPRQRQAVFDLGLEGLQFRSESHRVYPRGAQAGHVLGHVDVDGVGRMGVERAFEDALAQDTAPLQLTLDSGVQFALETELAAAAERFDVVGAAGIVMAAHSGEIRALASWPSFDPNRPGLSEDDERLNRATGAVYELGSIFKPFTIAAALDAGAIAEGDRFDVRAPIVIAGKAITDTHRGTANMTVTDVLAESSNIGTVQIAERLGGDALRAHFSDWGLFARAPIDFTASAAPLLPQNWGPLEEATLSYGHGIAVTPLAFTQAFAAFATDGEIVVPQLVASDAGVPSRPVISPRTAVTVRDMLRQAVLDGTGEAAQVAGFRVAGKTGTAEKPVQGGYAVDRNINSFAALFPADSPEFVVLIVLDDPRPGEGEGATAAWNAAPVAGRVIERIAPHLGVAPRFDAAPARDARASDERRAL